MGRRESPRNAQLSGLRGFAVRKINRPTQIVRKLFCLPNDLTFDVGNALVRGKTESLLQEGSIVIGALKKVCSMYTELMTRLHF